MDITKQLQEYDYAVDFYMDNGYLPNNMRDDDLLVKFIVESINDNPQLESQDPLWKELLKEEMMKFIQAMLKLFQPLEEKHKQEKKLIYLFTHGETEERRKAWEEANLIIRRDYTKEQVNIGGYSELLNEENREAVLTSLAKDWDKACDEKLLRKKEAAINKYINEWQKYIQEHGMSDFKEHKRIEKFVASYPALAEIVRIMGREQPKQKEEKDETFKKFLPILPSPPKPAVEIEEITTGQSLRHMMPVEMAIMSDHETESLFYLKYATHKLQLFANKPKEESRFKLEKNKQVKPRLEKGPIIVSLDTSGSMSGRPIKLAKNLLLQLLMMAKRQKRKCFLITFSVRAKYLDLSQYGAWTQLNEFLDNHFSGGTDGEEMLNAALEILQTDNFAMADVLIISDFYFNTPINSTQKQMKTEHDKGTRFYGLQIDSSTSSYDNILDKIWHVRI